MTIEVLKNDIEILLKDENYCALKNLLDNNDVKELLGKDQELYIINILFEVNRIEIENNVSTVILSGHSLKEAVRIYKELVLLLRRLEFDLPIEYQNELISYMKENGISVIGVWAIIQEAEYLYAKELIVERFKRLL